jgi:hypothetical protein
MEGRRMFLTRLMGELVKESPLPERMFIRPQRVLQRKLFLLGEVLRHKNERKLCFVLSDYWKNIPITFVS